jgi:hypothetical protein
MKLEIEELIKTLERAREAEELLTTLYYKYDVYNKTFSINDVDKFPPSWMNYKQTGDKTLKHHWVTEADVINERLRKFFNFNDDE